MYTFCTPEVVDNLKVIHYGSKLFLASQMLPVSNEGWVKPKGGLWTSPTHSEWGWKDWCDMEHFRECTIEMSFVLKFKEGTKILVINKHKDLLALPMVKCEWGLDDRYPDYEAISLFADAIWLTEKGQERTRLTYPISLYGWDCETILILNKDCCYQVE